MTVNTEIKNGSYKYLGRVNSPDELKTLGAEEIPVLCDEIRDFLVKQVSETGGHLASNLGAVELSVAIHRNFDCPHDRVIFDVGHQSYVHKILTGRYSRFDTLRQSGGLSGFTKREESEYDCFGAGHSSTSLSAALGFVEADKLLGNYLKSTRQQIRAKRIGVCHGLKDQSVSGILHSRLGIDYFRYKLAAHTEDKDIIGLMLKKYAKSVRPLSGKSAIAGIVAQIGYGSVYRSLVYVRHHASGRGVGGI